MKPDNASRLSNLHDMACAFALRPRYVSCLNVQELRFSPASPRWWWFLHGASGVGFALPRSESASTRTISVEGLPRPRQIRTAPQRPRFDTRTAPQRECFDARDLRRGFAEAKTNSHRATARALRHAQCPHSSPRPRQLRTASGSASPRTISAEGSPRSRQICTAPQRERFDTHDLRRGVRFASSRGLSRPEKKKN